MVEVISVNAVEEYFKQENILFERITAGVDSTPDYKVLINNEELINKELINKELIVEFKEFEFSENDKTWQSRRIFTKTEPPGLRRIRNKIKECSKQFKNYQSKPTLCILCNTGCVYVDLSTQILTMAMLGDIIFNIPIVSLKNNSVVKEGFFEYGRNAPSQIARKPEGSLISAVGVLEGMQPKQKIIDKELESLYLESKQNNWNTKQTLEQALKKVEKIKNTNQNINFDESKWRLRIIRNPYAKVLFPKNIFNGEYNEEWTYEDNLGFKKL